MMRGGGRPPDGVAEPASCARGRVQRSKAHGLLALTRRSLAEMATSSRAGVWTLASERWLGRAELPHARFGSGLRRAGCSAHPGAPSSTSQTVRAGYLVAREEVWRRAWRLELWTCVGRADDPCRSVFVAF